METIYTFNGEDITMLVCVVIREVIREIAKRENSNLEEAFYDFYRSDTYKTLRETENALWAEPAGYIADMYFAEKQKKQVVCA